MNTFNFSKENFFFKGADESTKGFKVYADEGGGWIGGEVWCEPRIQHKRRKIILSPEREPSTGLFFLCDHPRIN